MIGLVLSIALPIISVVSGKTAITFPTAQRAFVHFFDLVIESPFTEIFSIL